jgi:dolichol-phosphate mannosyltransferase
MTDPPESRALPQGIPPRQDPALPHFAERITVATAMAGLADVLIFMAATVGGLRVGPAHILSFVAATALNYHLNIRVVVAATGRARDFRLYGRLLVVSLLALFLRGGVLSLLMKSWAWPPFVAIIIAIGATLAITLPGYAIAVAPSSAWRVGSGTRWRVLALGLIVYAFVLRLVYLGQVELLPEETYYWNYSRHLDIGYLDHPPMVAWLIRLSTAVVGNSELGVRGATLFCAAATAFFAYRLTRNLFDAPSALAAMLLSQILPFFFVAGLVMTPDAPLVAAWAAGLYFLERALVAGRSGAWWGAGLSVGIGLLCKYSIGLLAPVAFLFMLIDPQSRRWLWHWRPYVAALIALAIFSPVLVWNARNEWASFVFQTSRRLEGKPEFALHKLILAALVLLTPTGACAAAASLWDRRRDRESDIGSVDVRRKWRFIQLAVLVPLAAFMTVSLRHNVKFDWTGELWLAAVPAMAFTMTSAGGKLSRIRAAWTPTILGLLLIYAAGLHFLILGLPGLGYGETMELLPVGWRDLGQQVSRIAKEVAATSGSRPLVVGMDRYAITSEVAFYTNSPTTTGTETSGAHLFEWTGLMYERWVPRDLQNGRTLLLVTWKPQDLTDRCVESRAERLGPVQTGVLMRDSKVIRRYYYRVAYGYRSSPPCA